MNYPKKKDGIEANEYSLVSNYFEAENIIKAQEKRDMMSNGDVGLVEGVKKEIRPRFVSWAKRNNLECPEENYIEFLVDDIVGHGGYHNLNKIWFDSFPHKFEAGTKKDELGYWRELSERTNKLIARIFPGLFNMNNQMDCVIEKIDRPEQLMKGVDGNENEDGVLLKGYTKRFPLNREEFEVMIKCRFKNRIMDLLGLVYRGYQEPRSRAITKHFGRLIEQYSLYDRYFKKITYLKVDKRDGSSRNLIYNPTPEQIEQFGSDKLCTGYVLEIYSDINKCPLFILSDAKSTASAVRKYLTNGNLHNPNDIYDYFRATVLFPPDDNKLAPVKYHCKNDLEQKCLSLYDEQMEEISDRKLVYDVLMKNPDLPEEQKVVMQRIHQHYEEQDKIRRSKILGALAKLIEIVGSTYYPDRTKDGFRNGKTNEFSMGVTPRYNLTFTYRPTYNRGDISGVSKELEELINSSVELKRIAARVGEEASMEVFNSKMRLLNYIVKGIVNMFRWVGMVDSKISTDQGMLYHALREKLSGEYIKKEPDQEKITCYQQAVCLMEELAEISSNNNTRPYLNVKGSHVEPPTFENFKRTPGAPIPFEIQFRDYMPEEEYKKDHSAYIMGKNVAIGRKFGIDKFGDNSYRVMDFSQFISDLVDTFCAGYDFSAYNRTVNAWCSKKNSSSQKPLSVRENIKFWLLKILARDENKGIIKDILKGVALREVRLREFLRLIEDEMKREDICEFRRCEEYEKWLRIVKNRLVECRQELIGERRQAVDRVDVKKNNESV